MGGPHCPGDRLLAAFQVHGDDGIGAGQPRPLHNIQTDTSHAPDGHRFPGFDLGRAMNGPPAGPYAASEQTGLVQWKFPGNFNRRNFRRYNVFTKTGDIKGMVDDFTLGIFKPGGTVQ